MSKVKVIGFQAGQYGDLIMAQPLCRTIKKVFPDSEMTLGISHKYQDIAGLFLNNRSIDKIHIWESYDDFPKPGDAAFIQEQKFDIRYRPNPVVLDRAWFKHMYIIDAWRHSYEMPPDDNTIELTFPYYKRPEFEGVIALSLFSWLEESPKAISFERACEINRFLIDSGHKTLQLGLQKEKDIGATYRYYGGYLDSAISLLSCRMLVSIDTSWVWVASAFKLPVVGMFGYEMFKGATTSRFWQARNPNATYLERGKVSEIPINEIQETIKTML